jgi:hypothetical protein
MPSNHTLSPNWTNRSSSRRSSAIRRYTPNSTPQRVSLNLPLGPLAPPKVIINPVNPHLRVGMPVVNPSVSVQPPCPNNAPKSNKTSLDSLNHKKLRKSAQSRDKAIKQSEHKSSEFASRKEKDSKKRTISPEPGDEYAAS